MVSLFSLSPPFSWWLILHFYLISWAFCFAVQETWQQWIPKDSNSSGKGLLGFPGIIKNRKKTKSCAQAETDGHVVNEIACANAFSDLGPMLCSLLPGQGRWGSELDMCMVLPGETSALDDECSHGLEKVSKCTFPIWEEVQLWSMLSSACTQGLQFPFCCCIIHGFAPQSSRTPCQGVCPAHPCRGFKPSEGCHPYLLWQGAFIVICATPVLTGAQDLPSRAGQKADFMSHEKMSTFKCFYCKGGRKGQICFFLLTWCPREICSALILLSFLFFSFLFLL